MNKNRYDVQDIDLSEFCPYSAHCKHRKHGIVWMGNERTPHIPIHCVTCKHLKRDLDNYEQTQA